MDYKVVVYQRKVTKVKTDVPIRKKFNNYTYNMTDRQYLIVFTETGKMRKVQVKELSSPKLMPIEKYYDTESFGSAVSVIPEVLSKDYDNLFFFTENGYIKKGSLQEYVDAAIDTRTGIHLKEGDKLLSVQCLNEENIAIMTNWKNLLKFSSIDVPTTHREDAVARRGIVLAKGDKVYKGMVLPLNDEEFKMYSLKSPNMPGSKMTDPKHKETIFARTL